jgi:hypothetical protein
MRIGHLAIFLVILAALSVTLLFFPSSSTIDLLLHTVPSVPPYPGAKDVYDSTTAGRIDYRAVTFTTGDSKDTVEKFYMTVLQNEGWTYSGKKSVCERMQMEFRKSTDGRAYYLKLDVSPHSVGAILREGTRVSIMVSRSDPFCQGMPVS